MVRPSPLKFPSYIHSVAFEANYPAHARMPHEILTLLLFALAFFHTRPKGFMKDRRLPLRSFERGWGKTVKRQNWCRSFPKATALKVLHVVLVRASTTVTVKNGTATDLPATKRLEEHLLRVKVQIPRPKRGVVGFDLPLRALSALV